MLPRRMLPFALSRFIAAHFSAPKQEPQASVRWRALHGHSWSLGVQSYAAIGGMAGHHFTPAMDESNVARAQSKTPFEDALAEAQNQRSQLPLLEPFVGALGIGKSKSDEPFFALLSVRSERACVVGWSDARQALDRVCADDLTSFAALNFISHAVLGRGQNPSSRTLKPLIGALDDRTLFPPPYAPLEARFADGDLFPVEWMPDPPPNRFYLRSAYLMALLAEGEFSVERWADYEQPEASPDKALKNIPRSAPTALYWLFRLFFEGHDDALQAVLEACKTSKAAWIVDAARVVAEVRAGRRDLGTIEDVQALREHVSRMVRDPAVLAARKATQRRPTIDKRIGAMRVPSGLRFEAVDKVPAAAEETEPDFVTPDEGGLLLREGDQLRALLPPEPDTTHLQAVRLDGDIIAVLTESPGEKATKRRMSLYHLAPRMMRLGGHVFQDIMGKSGLVRVQGNAIALWKEAVEEERMFPWTGRTTLYGLIEGNLVSLGGASYDAVGARVVDGAVYGLRADGSGYRASGIDDAIENQTKHHAGPRFAPIPLQDAAREEGWRDVFAPGPVTVENGMLRWNNGTLPRSRPCPGHLVGDLGVSMSRDGKIAWLMNRTGNRIDRLELATGAITLLCEWPTAEGWPVGVAQAGDDLVVVSTWRIRVVKTSTRAELWSKAVDEAQSVAGLPTRHFAVMARGGSGPGVVTLYYVRELDEAPENEADAAGEWSSYGYSGEPMFLCSPPNAIAVVGSDTSGTLDPEVFDKVPHWARSRGWFGEEKSDGDGAEDSSTADT